MFTLYLVRHGEVHNPNNIIYGRLPNFGLNQTGQAQIATAAERLANRGPFHALYASPLQRAQESSAILANRLGLTVETVDGIVETSIGGYEGKSFNELPSPYITETPTHAGLESAGEIRSRMLGWVADMQTKHAGQQIIAVSHRDPIIVSLLHWMGQDLADLPDFDLPTGGVYEVQIGGDAVSVAVVG